MLVAATGLAGSGKTTSLKYLESIGVGTYLHVGGIVNAELAVRGLALTPENERLVRGALRAEEGMAALAKRAAPALGAQLNAGKTVLIDAVCNMEESEFYRGSFGSAFKVIAIDAPFEARAVRLESRELRPISRTQLIDRDRYEQDALYIDKVIAHAEFTIENHDSKTTLMAVLQELASGLSC